MGAAARAGLAAAALALLAARPARAEPCLGQTPAGHRFPTCFDFGNRLRLDAGTDGYGGAVALRHVMRFDDEPDLVWKLEHVALAGRVDAAGDAFEVELYGGRYLRHARDGHVVLPFSVARKLFLPFDIGADVGVGRWSGRFGDPIYELGVVRSAALVDWSRSDDFTRRLALGVGARWDMRVDHAALDILEQTVAPLSLGVLDARFESAAGRTAAGLRVEAGRVWSSETGWGSVLWADASMERVLVAVNDRPLSLVVGARYRSDADLVAQIGLRFAPLQRHPLRSE